MADWERDCRFNTLIYLLHRLAVLHWGAGNAVVPEEREGRLREQRGSEREVGSLGCSLQ